MNRLALPTLLLILGSSPLMATNAGLNNLSEQVDKCLQKTLKSGTSNHHEAAGHVADSKVFIEADMTYSALDALSDAENLIGHLHPHM